jgi:polyhydroxybutyrate depolymerase
MSVRNMTNMINFFFIIILFIFQSCEEPAIEGKNYRFNLSMEVDGRMRTYLLVLPPGYYKDSTNFPLVIAMHGGGGSASQFEKDYKFTEAAQDNNSIVVYPEGVQSDGILKARTWNAGSCCNYAVDHAIDDVNFISKLIKTLKSNYRINHKKVFATGMSNGGMMAYRLACEIPDKIAAIAVVSCTMVTTQPCDPTRPVPILHMHSILDKKVPYEGGTGIRGYYFPPVDSGLKVFAEKNYCLPIPQIVTDDNRFKLTRWIDCKEEAVIEYYLTKDGGHAWPGGIKSRELADTPSTVINANELIFDFFDRFELP